MVMEACAKDDRLASRSGVHASGRPPYSEARRRQYVKAAASSGICLPRCRKDALAVTVERPEKPVFSLGRRLIDLVKSIVLHEK